MRFGTVVCGYDSCPCKGVHFISRSHQENEYCVDGKRVRLDDDSIIHSFDVTGEMVSKLEAYLLEQHSQYCIWHAEQLKRYGDACPPLCPFAHTFPLLIDVRYKAA